jgi:hypothetical protein
MVSSEEDKFLQHYTLVGREALEMENFTIRQG